MKSYQPIVSSMLFIVLPHLSVSADESAFKAQRLERLIAKRAAIKGVAELLQNFAPAKDPKLKDHLSDAIEKDPKSHKLRRTSEQLCRQIAVSQLKDGFDSRLTAVLKKTNAGILRPITRQELHSAVNNLDSRVAAACDQFLRLHFLGKCFQPARANAVNNQFKQIDVAVTPPSFAEVNQALQENPSWNAHVERFRRQLFARHKPASLVLYEENEGKIKKKIGDVLTDISQQYGHQIDFAKSETKDSTVPTGCITRNKIVEHVTGKFPASLKQFERNGRKPYEMFDIVADLIEERSADLELNRLTAYIAAARLTRRKAELVTLIENAPERHRNPDASQRLVVSLLMKPFREAVATSYVKRGEPRESEVQAAKFLSLMETGAAKIAVQSRVSTLVAAALPPARESVAASQIAQHFPGLKSWAPSVELVTQCFDEKKRAANFETAAGWLSGKSAEAVPSVTRATLLLETEQEVTRTVNAKLDKGVAALRSQLVILRDMELNNERRQRLRADVFRGIGKTAIVERWTADLQTLWQGRADATYQALFPRTREAIAKAVSVHYNAVRDQSEAATAADVNSSSQRRSAATVAGGGLNQAYQLRRRIREERNREVQSGSQRADGSGGNGGGGGAGGGGGRGGGEDDARGNPGNQADDKSGTGSGKKGPPPDCTLALEDYLPAGSDRCIAGLTVTAQRRSVISSSPISCQFSPQEVERSAQSIAIAIWPGVERVLRAKFARGPLANQDEESEEFVLRVHVAVRSTRVRHHTSLMIRRELESRCNAWAVRHRLNAFELHWSDGL